MCKNYTIKTIEDGFYTAGLCLLLLSAFVAVIRFFVPGAFHMPPCPFHLLTGCYCPGCGGTRAVRALLGGHLLRALWFHPFVPYAACVCAYFMVTQTIERVTRGRIRIGMRYRDIYVWIAVALTAGNFILKNALHFAAGM